MFKDTETYRNYMKKNLPFKIVTIKKIGCLAVLKTLTLKKHLIPMGLNA